MKEKQEGSKQQAIRRGLLAALLPCAFCFLSADSSFRLPPSSLPFRCVPSQA
jgi:hypothetical protein